MDLLKTRADTFWFPIGECNVTYMTPVHLLGAHITNSRKANSHTQIREQWFGMIDIYPEVSWEVEM